MAEFLKSLEQGVINIREGFGDILKGLNYEFTRIEVNIPRCNETGLPVKLVSYNPPSVVGEACTHMYQHGDTGTVTYQLVRSKVPNPKLTLDPNLQRVVVEENLPLSDGAFD